jgi:hypothetical protein
MVDVVVDEHNLLDAVKRLERGSDRVEENAWGTGLNPWTWT